MEKKMSEQQSDARIMKHKNNSSLRCKLGLHKMSGFVMNVRGGKVKQITYYCERCTHKEVCEVQDGDVGVGFAVALAGVER